MNPPGDSRKTLSGPYRSPQQALSLLRAGPGPRQAVPIRYVGPEFVKRAWSEPEIQARIKAAPIRVVPIAWMVAGQHTVKAGRVESYIKKPGLIPPGARAPGGWPIDLPICIKFEGQHLCWDGHHRLTAEMLLGAEKIRVRYVDLDAP